MPLHEVSNTARLRNKENVSQVDSETPYNGSPIKQPQKYSPQKKPLNTELTQLKIRLSDRQFELKRLEEDCAVKLALMQKQLTKQKNEKKQLTKEWKQKFQEDRQYFERQIQIVEEEWKKKVIEREASTRRETEQRCEKQMEALILQHKNELKEILNSQSKKQTQNQSQTDSLIAQHDNQIAKMKAQHEKQIQQLQAKFSEQSSQLRQSHLSQVQFYHQLQDQKTKQHNVIVRILSDKIRGFQEEIRLLKQRCQELVKDAENKNREILAERREKEDYRLDKICLERKLARLQPQIREQFEKTLQQNKAQYETSLKQQINKFTQHLSSLESIHHRSITNYQAQISELQQRSKQVALIHQAIKSNEEDLKKIEVLEMKLIKKDMQLEKEREDLKMCKLELNNMDQIYRKMFEEAKLKALKPKRQRLPSLLSVGQNRSTTEVYIAEVPKQREKKKFSIRQINYHVINKTREQNGEFVPYQ